MISEFGWIDGTIILDTVASQGRLHDVALTGAGRLPAKNVLHINATHASNDWEGLLSKALKIAEDNWLTSLAMPAVGTGQYIPSQQQLLGYKFALTMGAYLSIVREIYVLL